jgi:hypothetical protein
MARISLFTLLILAESIFAASQTCVWSNGDVADGYIPCNSSASQGSCCLQGEACLSSGLCFGGGGLVYRGACLNQWGSSTCPTHCDDGKSSPTCEGPRLVNFRSPKYPTHQRIFIHAGTIAVLLNHLIGGVVERTKLHAAQPAERLLRKLPVTPIQFSLYHRRSGQHHLH